MYLKSGPLQTFQNISSKLGQRMQWKISHFEEVTWSCFTAQDISEALKVYDAPKPSTSIKRGKKSQKEEKESSKKLTKGKFIFISKELVLEAITNL
jgi:hypothetical protein